jgi:Radical SAM superfamily
MAEMGTYAISFIGGEVLLREDLGHLLSECRKLGIRSRVTSNGSLVTRHPDRVQDADILKLSLDGPRALHDELRGEGSFRKVIEAARWARGRDLKVQFNCVLSGSLHGRIPEVLDIAAAEGVTVTFQPAENRTQECGGDMGAFLPTPGLMREMIGQLKRARKRYPGLVGNSIVGLDYMQSWPVLAPVSCHAGLLFGRLLPDGRLVACDRETMGGEADAVAHGFRAAFGRLREVGPCPGCWRNNTIDINLALSGDPWALLGLIRSYL